MYLDNRHVVRSLVLHGIVDPDIVACIEETMLEGEGEEMENRKVRDESHGAEEPVGYLRREVKPSLIENRSQRERTGVEKIGGRDTQMASAPRVGKRLRLWTTACQS